MKKIIFIDIDGTLINNSGKFPESSKDAITKAREKGHLVFINTGRSRSQVFKYIEDIGFDGFICSEGLYVEYGGKTLREESLSSEQVDLINEYVKKENLGFMAEGHRVFLVNQRFIDYTIQMVGEEDFERFKLVFPYGEPAKVVPYEGIGKINFPVQSDYSTELQKEFGSKLRVGYFTDDAMKGGMMTLGRFDVDKMIGVNFILEYLNQQDAETYAFGDTGGDIGMVTGCTYGIAMGNASECLKEKADFVTDSVDENGLYNAFVKYGLI